MVAPLLIAAGGEIGSTLIGSVLGRSSRRRRRRAARRQREEAARSNVIARRNNLINQSRLLARTRALASVQGITMSSANQASQASLGSQALAGEGRQVGLELTNQLNIADIQKANKREQQLGDLNTVTQLATQVATAKVTS